MIGHRKSLLPGFTLLADAVLGTLVYTGFLLAGGMWNAPSAKASVAVVGLIYLYVVFNGGLLLYKEDTRSWQIPLLVLKNSIKLAVASFILLYVSHTMVISAASMSACFVTVFVSSSLFRLAVHAAVRAYWANEAHCRNVVLVGSSPSNRDLYAELSRMSAWGYRVLGYFDYEPAADFPASCPYLGTPGQANAYIAARGDVASVYCSLSAQDEKDILSIVHYCAGRMIGFYNVPQVRNYLHNRLYFSMVGAVPVLSLYESPLSDIWRRAVKRLFDICFSLLFLCTFFLPVVAVVSVITMCTMPGPVFFAQKRNGRGGKVFRCLKFRSMKVNDEADVRQATPDDPRTTRWGRVMRKYNIDELPQFINVLLGDMSIVGPRPHMQKHTEEYSRLIDRYMVRHLIKPGITGWSQVTGFRGETRELWQMEGRIKGDIWYIEHWSFGLDLLIIYKTVANMFKGDAKAC